MWNQIQERIWACEICRGHEKVACNIRQQTDGPERDVKLLVVGIAPPFVKDVSLKTKAKSATNDPDDRLRKFIVSTLGLPWDDLKRQGLFFIHSVKCGIVPNDRHQNPPPGVVNICAPLHLGQEIDFIRPSRIVSFGKEALRGIFNGLNVKQMKGFGISKSIKILSEKTKDGLDLQTHGWKFALYVSPFPLNSEKDRDHAAGILKHAARDSTVTVKVRAL